MEWSDLNCVLTVAEEDSNKSSVDSLLLVVIDQVLPEWLRKPKLNSGPDNLNQSDLTFLLDMEGGGGFCFHDLHQEEQKKESFKQ